MNRQDFLTCTQCGYSMIPVTAGRIFCATDYSADISGWIWWCKCGNSKEGGVYYIGHQDQLDSEWEKANHTEGSEVIVFEGTLEEMEAATQDVVIK